MLNPDFLDRTYTAEVIKTKLDAYDIFKTISELILDSKTERYSDEFSAISLCHGFATSPRSFHRFPRIVRLPNGTELSIPRQKLIRGKSVYLYDVIVGHCKHHDTKRWRHASGFHYLAK